MTSRARASYTLLTNLLARPDVLLAVLLVAVSAIVGRFLVYDDLNLQYPFMFPDSYDWVANGLYYAGYTVNYTVRPPGLPLIIAGLVLADALRLLPLANLAVMLGILAVCYRLFIPGVTRAAALVTITLLFASYFFFSLAFYVLADLYCLLFIALSLLEFVRAREAPRRYVTSALYLGISLVFQYAGIVLLPAYALVWLLCRRGISAWRHLGLAVATAVATLTPWLLYRWVTFGDPLYSRVMHVQLVRWRLDSIPFYLFNTVGAAGVAACVLGLIGLAAALRRSRDERLLLMLLVLASNVAFWVLLYDWNDRRFVLYWLIPIYYLAAHGVGAIIAAVPPFPRRGAVMVAVTLVLALYANLDCGSPLSVDRIALSPWHHLVAPAVARGSGLDIDMSALHLEHIDRGAGDSLAVAKPLAARRLPPAAPSPTDVAEARRRLAERYPDGVSTLWFHFGTGEMRSWYVLRNRYGNAFLTVLQPVASLADVPGGAPVLMLKPYDPQTLGASEVLWEGPDAILLIAGGEGERQSAAPLHRVALGGAQHERVVAYRQGAWAHAVGELWE